MSGSSDDLFLWPDGTCCYRDEFHEMTHKSDDYILIKFDHTNYQWYHDHYMRDLSDTDSLEEDYHFE